jgi:DNA-binding transcriptional LysR family regulator
MSKRHTSAMDLKHLRYFVAAVEEGSMQAASEKLAVTQPALSRRIQDLEADLGCELFIRRARGVTPTRAGQAFYREALQVLEKMSDAVQVARRIGLAQGRESRLGVVHAARKYGFIHEALAAYAQAHPDAGVAITRGSSSLLAAELREGRLDATLLFERHLGAPRFSERLVHRERYVLAMHPAHRLATPGPVALQDLAGAPFVWLLRRVGVDGHDHLLQHCRLHGLDPVIGQLANSPEELIDLVVVSGGICLTPASTALTTPAGQLVFRSVPALGLELDLTLAWGREPASASAKAFLAELHAAVDRHQAEIDSGRAEWARLDGASQARTT